MITLFKILGLIGLKGVDETKKQLKETTDTAQDESNKLSKKVEGFGKTAKQIGKVALTGAAAAATAIGTITKFGVDAYAKYEQMTGGVETLFGAQGMTLKQYAESVGQTTAQAKSKYDELMKAQNLVMENASKAYQTAGLSANDYMETITSFAASLKQSTQNEYEAATVANQAVIDMSDNANKMGTNMQDIQNAYQGFSKQNYTMLDNLKLGYGGTKTEMERLLADAEKLTGVHYDISNLSDVYNAIHAIQENLGITNTTAEEAATTIDGAIGMTKASWENLMVAMSDSEQDVGPVMDQFSKSLDTLAKNVIPKIKQVFDSLPNALVQIIPALINTVVELAPSLINATANLIGGLITALPGMLSPIFTNLTEIFSQIPSLIQKSGGIVDSLLQSIDNDAPSLITKGMEIISSLVSSIVNALPSVVAAGARIVDSLGSTLSNNMPTFMEKGLDILVQLSQSILTNLPVLVGVGMKFIFYLVQGLMNSLPTIISKVPVIITNLANAFSNSAQTIFVRGVKIIAEIIKGLIMAIPSLVANIPKIVQAIIAVWNAIQWWNLGKNLITGIKEGIVNMGGSLKENVSKLFSDLKNNIKDIFENVKKVIESPILTAKTKVLGVIGEMRVSCSNIFNGIKSIASAAWNGIKNAIMNPMTTAKNFVKAIINTIKGFFHFKISWPHIPLPHFNIKPSGWNVGDLLKGKIPSLGIKWYAQAKDNPMILDNPTIFGMNNGSMLGAGEAGAEVVAGKNTLMNMIRVASNSGNDEVISALNEIISLLRDEDKIHDILVKALTDGSFSIVLDNREVGRIVRKYA